MQGIYEVKDENIGRYFAEAERWKWYFDNLSILQIPREHNQVVDALAKATTLAKEGDAYRIVPILELHTPS